MSAWRLSDVRLLRGHLALTGDGDRLRGRGLALTLRDQITVHFEVHGEAEYALGETLGPGPLMCRER